MNNFTRHICIYLFCLPILFGMASCVDDFVIDKSDNIFDDSDGGGLVFAIDTRGGFPGSHTEALSQSEEEIVINPQNFHVVLFSLEGEVQQIWANQELTEITEMDPTLGEIKKYYVKIPRHDITDETVNYIREKEFKIAVFANWDGYPDFETKQKTKDPNGIWRNFIYYISHCRVDNSYQSSGVDGQLDDSEVFDFITGKGSKMGIAQEWVCERFKTDADADAAIRANYQLNDDGTGKLLCNTKPILTNSQGESVAYSDMEDFTYNNLWTIWNFGGDRNLNVKLDGSNYFYNSTNDNLRSKWAQINNDWKEVCFNGNTSRNISGTKTIRDLSLVSPDGSGSSVITGVDRGGYSGVVLRSSNRQASQNQKISVEDGTYINIKVPADGYLYVKCRSNSQRGATLVARRGDLQATGNSITYNSTYLPNNQLNTLAFDYTNSTNQIVRITDRPEDVVLYAIGGEIDIYEIDYIKSRMLQVSDRQMINPASTPEGGISMYGIQDFDELPTSVWPEGTTFNLSRYQSIHTGAQAPNYAYRTISLLRSVAKVEVLVPTYLFPEPSHMFMRTINRFSRSAPIDVFTPTNIIWEGWDSKNPLKYRYSLVYDINGKGHDYQHTYGVDYEAESIRNYGFTYKYDVDPKLTDEQKLAQYRSAVSWLFGIWESEYGWDWNGSGVTIPADKPKPYPSVFNTRISRSDYAHMINGGKVIVDGQQYYYYYAYLPEKNITDPNDKGTLNEAPKVMRIEMRFSGRNTDTNLDDNACYRIYFMPDGKGQGINSREDYDDKMEKGNSSDTSDAMINLHNIYPVMRNHLYRFKIVDLEMNRLRVNFEVKAPDTRDVKITFE